MTILSENNCHFVNLQKTGIFFSANSQKLEQMELSSVVFLGSIEKAQKPLEKKLLPSITKLSEFEFKPDGTTIAKRVCMTGSGQPVNMAPVEVIATYEANVMNEHHLLENGQPKRMTSKPLEKAQVKGKRKGKTSNQNEKRLSIPDFASSFYIKRFGMETLEELQPELDLGGKILMQKMELPIFSQRLKGIAVSTKRSQAGATLQTSLKIGWALPIWGDGKNPPNKDSKKFIEDIFEAGQKSKPVTAADAVKLMQEKVCPKGKPMFNENTFLDEDQIKSIFGTTSRQRKRKVTGAIKSGAEDVTVGVDFDDTDNGEQKQAFEEALADKEVRDGAAAAGQDAERVQTDIETEVNDLEEHPIMVDGENLCQIAKKLRWGLNVDKYLSKVTKPKQEIVMAKIKGDEYEPPGYVKKNCYCMAFHARISRTQYSLGLLM